MMLGISPGFLNGGSPDSSASGLTGRALLGWMDREQAVKFLTEDCVSSSPVTCGVAEEIWESHKAIVESLPREESLGLRKLPLSEADLKAARKFRNQHPEADTVVDFARLNPMDLVVHQLWVSTAIANGFEDAVTPDKWLRTALLDPPSAPPLKWRRDGDTIVFDLPRFEYVLQGPLQPDATMRVSRALDFVTVAFHANRALLLSGYHRVFACAQFTREAVNAPRGVLFGVSNCLEAMGSGADDVLNVMEGPRPPRMADFFDDRLFLPVTLRRRRYQMRIQCEVIETGEEATETVGGDDAPADGRGIPDGRVEAHNRSLLLKPDHAVANNNLGVALAAQGRIDEAAEHYERALVLKPDYVDARYNLGNLLSAHGDLEGAKVHQERVLALNPDHADAHHDLGCVLACQGQLDNAAAHFGRAIAIRPGYAEAHFHRAEIRTFQRGEAGLAALESLAASDGLSESNAPFIHFALAKAFDDVGDYARAFEHFRTGNALKRRQVDYNEPGSARFFQSLSTVFDSGLFDRFRGAGDPSRAPVLVLGMPRSGSSLIEQILASHPRIHGAGELPYIATAIGSLVNADRQPVRFPEGVPGLDGAALQRMGHSYVARLSALAPGKQRIVDKMQGNFLYIGLIRLILPNARIIHTMRDPIDTCVSCYSKLFATGQHFSYDLEELGRYYRGYTNLMSHWRSVLPSDAMLDVSYEELVDDLEGQARRLIEYCGLPWDDRCLAFHKTDRPVKTASAAQVRQPLFRSSLQRWRRYEAGIGPLLHELGNLTQAHARATA